MLFERRSHTGEVAPIPYAKIGAAIVALAVVIYAGVSCWPKGEASKEVEAVEERRGRFHRVGGETEVAHLARPAGRLEGLDGAARAENRFHFLRARHVVELVEIEVVGPQDLQRALQFLGRLLPAALRRLAGEKHVVSKGFESRTENILRVAVGRGDVEVVHPAFDRPFHVPGSVFNGFIHAYDPAETDC